MVLRYVALVDVQKKHLSVGLREVEASGPLGSLRGADNMVEFHSSIYSSSPLVVRGAGAGADVTAAGVLADMLLVGSTAMDF